MALEDIFRALEEQAEREREEILSAARAQAEAIEADATDQAARICSACVENADATLDLRSAREVNAARLEAKKRVAKVKQEAVAAAFERAAVSFEGLRSSPEYREVFRTLAAEALDGVDGSVRVLVDPADEELARATLADMGVEAEVDTSLTSHGGLVVAMDGGRVMRRNTVEDRLSKVEAGIQSRVAEIFFS